MRITGRAPARDVPVTASGCLVPRLGGGAAVLILWLLLFSPRTVSAAASSAPQDRTSNSGAETVTYDALGVPITALLVRPPSSGKHPAVLLIHDAQGLDDQMRKTAAKLSAEGFLVLVPDLLSRTGGTGAAQQVESAVSRLSPLETVQDLRSGFEFLKAQSSVDPAKISAIGFGWGGWRAFKLAASVPELSHAVIFYGATPVDGLENIHARIMANYAQYDFFDTGNSIWTQDTLQQLGTTFAYFVYPKTFRGFCNSDARHYDADASKLAWSRTLDFLRS
jgi:carboxymethylenebutenolidase